MSSYTELNHKLFTLPCKFWNIKLSIYILVLLLNCFTNGYGAWLELHVYFIFTNYGVIHTIMYESRVWFQIYTFLEM